MYCILFQSKCIIYFTPAVSNSIHQPVHFELSKPGDRNLCAGHGDFFDGDVGQEADKSRSQKNYFPRWEGQIALLYSKHSQHFTLD